MTSTLIVPAGHTLHTELDLHFTEPEMSYPTPVEPGPEQSLDPVAAADTLDEQILAALVSP